jgi:hypothetical protein
MTTAHVYVAVRASGSEAEIRTRVVGETAHPVAVPGSEWSCNYVRLGPMNSVAGDPRSKPY